MNNLRTCLRAPVPSLQIAADLLDQAATAHVEGNRALAAHLITRANMPEVRAWTESLWGAKSPYAPKVRKNAIGKARIKERMPSLFQQLQLHKRDGFACRYCGVPVIRKAIREYFRNAYPELALWGTRNIDQHAAFQAMWAQYDHVQPHSAGGTNEMGNLIVTCAPCNFAKMAFTLEECGLVDPRLRVPAIGPWDGLERVVRHAT
jgi:hypothetical protein